MGKTNKRIERKHIRVHQNPVTREQEVTVLDAVRLAFERVCEVLDGKMLALDAPADRERLAEMVLERVRRMLPHQEKDVA